MILNKKDSLTNLPLPFCKKIVIFAVDKRPKTMKKLMSLFAVCAMTASLQLTSQNINVSGLQNGVWDADTVWVTGDVYVNDSLVVMAGAKVIFCGEYGINVRNARLKAIGQNGFANITFKPEASTGSWNGIRAENSLVELRDCYFYDSKADSTQKGGGAIRLLGCEANITSCWFQGCRSYRSGGALYALNSEVSMALCNISDNICANDEVDLYSYGGGLFFAGSNASVVTSTFRGNSCAAGCGGGLCADSSSLVVSHCFIEDNYAANGGGISCIRANERLVCIDNVLIDHNSVLHYAGAIHIAQCQNVYIDNATLCDNTCQGGGGGAMQFHLGSKAVINNSIIWGNGWEGEGLLGGDQIWLWDIYSAPELHNCLLQGGIEAIHHSDNVTVYDDIVDEKPLFVDAAVRDYHLAEQSPCRNAGDSDLANHDITHDLDGLNRFSGSSIDMGAFEFQEGLSIAQHDEAYLRITPLCTHDGLAGLVVESDRPRTLSISVLDLLGRTLWQREVSVNTHDIVGVDACFATQTLLVTASGDGLSATAKAMAR